METAIIVKCGGCNWMAISGEMNVAMAMWANHVFDQPLKDEPNHKAIPSAISNPIKPHVVGYLLDSNVGQGVTR